MIRDSFALLGEYTGMAWQSIIAHKMRSILTTLGILIGVTTIITIWTTIQGLNTYIGSVLSDIGNSVVYVEKYPWVIKGDFWKYRNRKNIGWREYEAIRRHSRLARAVTPQVVASRVAAYDDKKLEQVAVLGTTESFTETGSVTPESGRFFTGADIRNKARLTVLGAQLAEELFKKSDPLGKRIRIGDLKYKVIGVLERQGDFFGQSRDNFAIVPIGTFRNVYGQQRGLQIAVLASTSAELEDLKEELRGILRQTRKVPAANEDDFAINQMDQLTGFYEDATATLYAIIFIIAAISLLVGGIGITNIMMVSVTERTREIGLRKAVGAKKNNILSQFLMEAIALSSIGGVAGILIGLLAGSLILSLLKVTGGVDLSAIFVGFGFSAFVGVVSGFYPAYKAATMNPIDSLRYE